MKEPDPNSLILLLEFSLKLADESIQIHQPFHLHITSTIQLSLFFFLSQPYPYHISYKSVNIIFLRANLSNLFQSFLLTSK